MKRTLVNRQSTTRKLLQLFLLCAVLLAPKGAWADSYNLWVGDTQVTDDNKDDVLGNNSGVSFSVTDGQTAPVYTLTLNGATLTGLIETSLSTLNIELIGSNKLTGYIKYVDKSQSLEDPGELSFLGNGSLEINSENSVITSFLSVNTDGFYLKSDVPVSYNDGGYYVSSLTITKSEVCYPIWVFTGADENQPYKQLTANAPSVAWTGDNASGTVSCSYENQKPKLTLNNAQKRVGDNFAFVFGEDIASMDVELVGTNQLGDGSGFEFRYSKGTPVLNFMTNGNDSGSFTVKNGSGYAFASGSTVNPIINCLNGLSYYEDDEVKGVIYSPYDLWIGDTQVTDGNKNDVLGNNSGVSFSVTDGQTAPVYTLTLNNATVTGPIKIGLDLTIDVKGTCSVTVPSGSVIMKDPNSQLQDINLTLKTSTADGYLTLTSTSSETIENGGVFSYGLNKSIDKSLGLLQPNDSYYLTDGSSEHHTASFVPSLGVTIGGTPIYNGNAEDVFEDGKVSFSNNILTLNGAKLSGPIESNIEELTIKIAGNNSLTLTSNGPLFQSQLDNATITIEQASNATGMLVASINSSESGIPASNVELSIEDPLVVLSGELRKTSNSSVIIGTQLFSGGNGSADSPYLIGSTDDLLNFSNWVNNGTIQTDGKYFQLNDNIDFTNESGYNFQPIGYEYGWTSYPFKGTFNGNNKKIIGLNVSSNFNYAGLFGLVGSNGDTNGVPGSISKVTLENCKFDGAGNVGAIAGNIANGSVGECIVDGCTILASDYSGDVYAGGVIGYCQNGTIMSNWVKGKTIVCAEKKSGTNVYSGAIAGSMSDGGWEFSNNLYYPTVITQTKVGDKSLSEKSGSDQRGLGKALENEQNQIAYFDIVEGGALLYYGITIGNGDYLITRANASNVFGDDNVATVSYDYDKNELTLNGATIGTADENKNIIVELSVLSVNIKDANTVYGGFELADNTPRDLIFTTNAANASLTMTSAIPKSFTVICNNKLKLNDDDDPTEVTLPTDYGITIAGTLITPSNHEAITGTNITGKVSYNGNDMLILEDATINGNIVLATTAELPENTLTVCLIGNSTITTSNDVAFSFGNAGNLIFVLDGNATTGKLVMDCGTSPSCFSNCTPNYDEHLAFTAGTIAPVLETITNPTELVADETFSTLMDGNSSTDNQVYDNSLLINTGDDTSSPGTSSGFDQTTGKLVLNDDALMTDDNLEDAMKEKIGSVDYASIFKGITAMLSPGQVEIILKKLDLSVLYDIYVKIGDQEPYSARKLLGIPSNQTIENANVTIVMPISSTQAMRIYLVKFPSTSAPAMLASHRIGPKSSVAGALGGVKVTSSSMQVSAPPAPTYKVMEKSQVTSAIASIGDAMGGYTCNDPDITDLPDDMFVDKTPSPAPRRGAGVKTILPDGLTFVNFSGTKITGMEVSREKGAFNGVPENVFIYMPAGNSVAKGTKNVVIGGICDVMELNGGVDAKPFKANKDFKAGQVTLKRTFEEGSATSKATIYLPYAISQDDANKLGKFYTLTDKSSDVVTMSQVTTGGLQANKPYIFEATTGGVVDPMIRTTDVVANPSSTDIFKGVYARKDYESGMYCYAAEATSTNAKGEFVEMGPGSYVPPFRAYMIGDGTPSYAILWDGVVENMEEEPNMTAVETVKTTQNKKAAEGWWTLNGVRLNGQPQKPGMYIVNGRLVVVK